MSTDINDSTEAAQPEETVVFQIIITKQGEMKLAGPVLADRTAIYGILEVAKDMIRDLHAPKIVKPNGGSMLNFVRGKR